MIEVGDPADLPRVVMMIRKSAGVTRLKIAETWARESGRHQSSTLSQIEHWEKGRKSPNLASINGYLRAHRLRLMLVQDDDPQVYARCPAYLRGDIAQPCAISVGHVGTHRTMKGREFW